MPAGSYEDPDNETSLLTVANYCGSHTPITWPEQAYFNDFSSQWANFLS